MFTKSAKIYDAIYLNMGKDYAAEAGKVHAIIKQHKQTPGNLLLDVACGTGLHIGPLCEHYQVEGLDLDENMLEETHKKYPDIPLHHGDMVDFNLDRGFDAITCLFSSIGYVKTVPRLNQAVSNMAKHIKAGGVLLIEPWFSPDTWNTGKVHATFVNQPDLKIARMNFSERKDNLSFFTFHYLVATPEGIEHFTELHELGLFTEAEYMGAFYAAGIEVLHDSTGLDGRGLYIGMKRTL
jgi:ubiquinone/menaquinone biosynthesis C-methylase UbiE